MIFTRIIRFFDWYRTVGKYITINTMLSKESVKKRMENPESGISYTEFSYMLLQGNDFVHLYENNGVKLQIGGSDQRGNMVTGTEMLRKKNRRRSRKLCDDDSFDDGFQREKVWKI